MDMSRGESVWVEVERYGALVNTNHCNLSARRIRDQLTNSGNHNLGLPPEAPTMPRGLVLVKELVGREGGGGSSTRSVS